MKKTVTTLVAMGVMTLAAHAQAQTRSPWQQHDGLEVTPANPLGLVPFTCAPPQHGAVCEYDVATIPGALDGAWGPAPDPDIIGFSLSPSRVCQAPGGQSCLVYGDFTYFQTFVDIPANVVVTTFTIDFAGMDDGSRVTIFNSAFPGGFVIPGSYVFLGGSGTTDLSTLVVSGETNRVVVTQVDDCCVENNLHSAVVVLNGEVIDTGCDSDAECDDGDLCSVDTCQPDGECTYDALSCDDGDACTADACVPETGCTATEVCPSCDDAASTLATIWPPNHHLVPVGVTGVVDPQGSPVQIIIDSIFQDEPTNTVGDGNTCPDASGVGTAWAWLRAERSGSKKVPGDGRVYHIDFTALDPEGNACRGSVTSCVPHDMGQGRTCIDQGPAYDSLVCSL
jgi:hypothetical protein